MNRRKQYVVNKKQKLIKSFMKKSKEIFNNTSIMQKIGCAAALCLACLLLLCIILPTDGRDQEKSVHSRDTAEGEQKADCSCDWLSSSFILPLVVIGLTGFVVGFLSHIGCTRLRGYKTVEREKYESLVSNFSEGERKVKFQKNEINELTIKNEQLHDQVQDFTKRLAAEMGEKVSSNETAVENVGIRNRPMNIADDYKLLCSTEWLDAKIALDEICSGVEETLKLEFLCYVFTLAEETANNCAKKLFESIQNPFLQLFDQSSAPKQSTNIPAAVLNTLGDYLRNNSHKLDGKVVVEHICNQLHEADQFNALWEKVKNEKGILNFINKVSCLAWNMAIQRPVMKFQKCTEWLGKDQMDLQWGSVDLNDEDVDKSSLTFHTLHPMMFHGKMLMAKGKVLVLKKSPGSPDIKIEIDDSSSNTEDKALLITAQ